jgi:hypothetical protein
LAGTKEAGLVEVPAKAPPRVTGVAPFLPIHWLAPRFAVVAPGLPEKWKRLSVGGVTGLFSTEMFTVLEGEERLFGPTSHSASAVLLIIFGALLTSCAYAAVLAAGDIAPAASTAAYCIMDLVNIFIVEKGGPSREAISLSLENAAHILLS